MRFGLILPSKGAGTGPALLDAGAGTAASLGWSSVWVTDHLLVPRGASNPASVRVGTYGNASNVDSAMSCASELLMPTRETGVHLGASLDSLQSPEVARCPQLMRHVLNQNGWASIEFDLYRCRVRYPILHTAISLTVAPMIPA